MIATLSATSSGSQFEILVGRANRLLWAIQWEALHGYDLWRSFRLHELHARALRRLKSL